MKGSNIMPKMPTRETVAAEAYQIIGALACQTETFDKLGVQKALDYFGDIANGYPPTRVEEILPWDLE
jgi:hypothetical protein